MKIANKKEVKVKPTTDREQKCKLKREKREKEKNEEENRKHEQSNKLSFLDVLVEKMSSDFLTTVYQKPTFTGQYIVYDSYCSSQNKVNLVRCTSCEAYLFVLLAAGGTWYPEFLLQKLLKFKLTTKAPMVGPARCSRIFMFAVERAGVD